VADDMSDTEDVAHGRRCQIAIADILWHALPQIIET